MRDLKIVFMGTPHFAVAILQALVEHNYNIVGVITAPDKPAGRGRKLQQSAVKEYALSKGLHIMQPTNLKDPDFIAELTELKCNLQIVVAFRMLPKVVWGIPEYGTFNLHASLLPNYRGAAPINWAIINGEEKTGVTTFFIDEKIDTGEIILQEETEISATETAGELHDRLMELGAKTVLQTVSLIAQGDAHPKKQTDDGDIKTAYKIFRETCKIDWNKSIDDIYNLIRGLSPYPTAWTLLNNNGNEISIKIFDVSVKKEIHEIETGTIISDKKEVKVAVREGYIYLNEIQLPGKRKMKIKDVLNGYEFDQDAKMR
ncbi:methionyl-tRNA formyltransferase [Flavobacteriaceae bacterium R38]|nr:methionyl-tRNA formyltransferase [Flavobacteriaceae bacterium R38]